MTHQLLLCELENLSTCPLAHEAGLNITTVAWEDTSRHKNSCWGSNISDLTLNTSDTRMPMIRKPNFSDVTADLDISTLQVTVGNEGDVEGSLRRIPLIEYVNNLGEYLGGDKNTRRINLAAPRDEVILCSAQACILPLHNEGEVAFVPELFNYQSTEDNPAVLAIVSTSQGTSTHIVTQRQQKLYFNRHGQATKYLAKRLSQDRAERKVSISGDMSIEEQDRNVLVIYQIPLKNQTLKKLCVKQATGKSFILDIDLDETMESLYQKTSKSSRIPVDQIRLVYAGKTLDKGTSTNHKLTELGIPNGSTVHMVLKLRGGGMSRGAPAATGWKDFHEFDNYFESTSITRGGAAPRKKFGMEHAMLRAADKREGDFMTHLKFDLERDDQYPIRATFQFYRVTDDANIGSTLFKDISAKIESVYEMAKEKGSLVIDTSTRKTETTKKAQATTTLPAMASVPTDAKPLLSAFSDLKGQEDEKRENDFVVVK